jgi:hypothetical protein
MNTGRTPGQLAQEPLDAFNARDTERCCAVCADDVQLLRLRAGEPFIAGKAALRAHDAKNRSSLPAPPAA